MGISGVNKAIKSIGIFIFAGQALAQVQTPSAPAAVPPSGRVYIAVGDPQVKKVLMAIEPTRGPSNLAQAFQQTLLDDLEFTDLFEFLPASKFPSSLGGLAPGSFNVDSYRANGVTFLVKSAINTKGSQVEAELRLYDVMKGVQILGRMYPLVSQSSQPARELAHYAGNDVIQTLTGQQGIFRTRLLASCGKRRKEIVIMDFDGSNMKNLTNDRNLALSPSWAPDGKRVLFTSYKPAVKGGFSNPNLYMVDVTNNSRKLISASKGLNTGGVFHPRENKIAYTYSRNGKPEIYVLDLNSNTRRAITETQFFSVEPNWSPDGSRIAFSSSKTGRPHIYVASADGKNPQRLTFAGVYNSSPNWSPQGDKIVFSGQENMGNNFNIFLVDPNGSNLVRLTDGSYSSENPVFSPDGRHLAFSSNRSGTYQIYVMTAKGTRIKALTPTSLGDCKQPAWSPRL